jgi:hypothetical protein
MSAEMVAVAREPYDARRHAVAQIAAVVGVGRATVYRDLAPAKLWSPAGG